ncbi:hypothetical protein [Cohaesibacter haloalkalitolerans]|uniref:hypothetical protein n=1 Tax=Cohaesibacter haloalkalitolerans TaxID=1162980 RepID=UPI000E65BA2E|nr:hypothetical protein [Cohaesibacter haloalkalitolerans]
MRISSAHKERGPGHAWLTMEVAATPATALVIERETDKDRYLGLQGWQSTPQSLPIEAVDGNRMLLGPSIVDYLKDGDFIKIIIAGTNHFEEDFWPVVPISGRRSSGFGIVSPQVMAADDQGPVASSLKVKAPLDRAEQPAMSEGEVGLPHGESIDDGTVYLDGIPIIFADPETFGAKPVRDKPVPEKSPVEAVPEVKAPEKTPKPKKVRPEKTPKAPMSRAVKGGLVAALVLLLVCGLGWYFRDSWLGASDNADQQATAEQAAPAESAATEQPQPGPMVRDRSYWQQQLLDGQMSGEQLFAAAEETAGSDELRDISADFLRLASNKGYMPALRQYAEKYDPAKPAAAGAETIKNATTALDAYTRLKAGGDEAAAADIRTLCQQLQPQYYQDANARTAVDDYCK